MSESQHDVLLIEAGRLTTIGAWTRTVAHEINNPLLAILGLVEFVIEDVEDGTESQAFLELIQQNGLEIKDVVRRLLEFTHEPADEQAAVPMATLTAETVELARGLSPVACGSISEYYTDRSTTVHGNANQLKQVLLHLIRRGERTMLDGGVLRIDVSCQGRAVRVAVTARRERPEASKSPPAEQSELELGLAVARAIARAHGGELRLRDQPRGAELVLTLPAHETTD